MNNSMNNFTNFNLNNQNELPQNINTPNNQYPFNNVYFNDPYFRQNLAMMDSSTKIINIINKHNEAQKKYSNIQDDNYWKEIITTRQIELNHREPYIFLPNNQIRVEQEENPFPPLLYTLANSIAQVFGMEDEAALFALLHFFTIAVHGRVHIQLDNTWSETMESYGVIIRRSGGRKTEFLRQLKLPFIELQSELRKEWLLEGHDERVFKDMKRIQRHFSTEIQKKYLSFTNYDEIMHQNIIGGILNNIEKELLDMYLQTDKNIHSTQPAPTLFLTEATPKALLIDMFHNGGYIASVNSENTFFKKSFLDKITSYLLAAHDGEYIDDRTKTAGSYVIDSPGISMLHMIQPHIASMFYGNSIYSDIGLSQRCIPFFSLEYFEPNVNIQRQMQELLTFEYAPRIQALVKRYFSQDINAPKFKLQIDKDAYNLIKEYEYNNLSIARENSFSPYESYIRKSHGQAIRYAAAIHAFIHAKEAMHEIPLSYDDVFCGISLMKILSKHAYYAFDTSGLQSHENAVNIVKALLRRSNGAESYIMTVSDINRMTHIKNNDIENALMFLTKNNLCEIVRCPRRATVVILHNMFYELSNNKEWQSIINKS